MFIRFVLMFDCVAKKDKSLFSTCTFGFLVATVLFIASHSAMANDPQGFEVSYDLREAERKAIMYKNLNLSAQESQKFWPLYAEYRAETKEQAKKMMQLLERFSKSFKNMSAQEAESIVNEALGNELEAMEEKKKHFKKVESVLSGASLFRYFQIDQRSDAIMKNNITRQIPLIPLDSMHADSGE